MSPKTYAKKFTDEQRDEYKRQQREEATRQLETAVHAIETSEGFRAWLDARARFHSYSLNNTLLIWGQLPTATRIASAKVWKTLGRYPAKGSTALRVFAPIEWNVPCEQDAPGARWNAKRERFERKIRKFKLVPVFDVSQTDGAELPEPPAPSALHGDSHAALVPALLKLAAELGYSVDDESLPEGMGGYCDATAKRIAIADGVDANARVRVLVHELAHALGVGYAEYGRDVAETIVESATYVVLRGQGFDLDATSVPYVAGWGQGAGSISIRTFAEKIDELARRIEGALDAE